MSALADRVISALGPGIVRRAGPLLPALIDALTGPLAEIDAELTVPGGAHGGAPLFDAALTPHPRWLAQAAGLRLPASLSTAAARAYLIGRGISRRGTPGALIAAARSALAGGAGIVRLAERVGGNAYAATITTYASQTPNPAAVLAAAAQEKPVGLVLSLTVLPGQTWGDVAASGLTLGDLTTITVRALREAAPDA